MAMSERDLVRVVHVRTGAEGTAPAFVIDGGDYADDDAVRAAVAEAWDELDNRRLVAEFETRPAGERPEWLPTWEQYRERLRSPRTPGGRDD